MTLVPFDDRDGQIWFDGKMVPWREARLHVLSHGLHYASGVFEGERAYAGNIFKLRAHSERLIQSGRILGFEIPYTAEEIDAVLDDVDAPFVVVPFEFERWRHRRYRRAAPRRPSGRLGRRGMSR